MAEISSPLSITERAGTITPDLINIQVKIHNGQTFSKPITISTSHIGKKFGCLIPTKKVGSSKISGRNKGKSR